MLERHPRIRTRCDAYVVSVNGNYLTKGRRRRSSGGYSSLRSSMTVLVCKTRQFFHREGNATMYSQMSQSGTTMTEVVLDYQKTLKVLT